MGARCEGHEFSVAASSTHHAIDFPHERKDLPPPIRRHHYGRRRGDARCVRPGTRRYSIRREADHHLLVGKGAQDFARNMGFKIEDDLNTEHSRQLWLEWKRRTDPSHYLDPKSRAELGHRVALQMAAEGLIDREHVYGTINCDGVNGNGEVCGV